MSFHPSLFFFLVQKRPNYRTTLQINRTQQKSNMKVTLSCQFDLEPESWPILIWSRKGRPYHQILNKTPVIETGRQTSIYDVELEKDNTSNTSIQ